ncbi:hypothetical protein PR202_gb02562 [Eleusine coracana subsp. coracana]|uniref:Uncharacterized protein n=1 Tax=Eleusine coracana subsp. coracana TaxID=191504 RepID=A0AAV5DX21_ELECO|nr:hypothetical protein PR202_gb02562 [Eleusine coracana subsp. coracana]
MLPWGADVNAKNLVLNAPMLLRLMEMRSQSDSSERFIESFAPDMAGIVQAHSSVDDNESKYLQIVPWCAEDSDFENSVQEVKGLEDQKISGKCLSDAYQIVLKRLAQLQELGQVGKGANKRKKWSESLELEPWIDSVHDNWGKHISLEELEDIDIGYDAPPPSFAANMELEKQRRARIEAAKQRIDAIRKAPTAIANHSQPVARNEDVCPPQKLPRKKRGRKRMDDSDQNMSRDIVVAKPNDPDGSKKRRKRVSLDGIDWEDCIIELLLLHGASETEIEEGQYRRLLELHATVMTSVAKLTCYLELLDLETLASSMARRPADEAQIRHGQRHDRCHGAMAECGGAPAIHRHRGLPGHLWPPSFGKLQRTSY